MSLTWWIVIYVIDSIFWLWVVRWGGAEILEGTFAFHRIAYAPGELHVMPIINHR